MDDGKSTEQADLARPLNGTSGTRQRLDRTGLWDRLWVIVAADRAGYGAGSERETVWQYRVSRRPRQEGSPRRLPVNDMGRPGPARIGST